MNPGAPQPDGPRSEPNWYKSGVIYEVHVRAFHDDDGDGAGDFRGLTKKLDYIQALGVTAIWLLPFYPSPLKDDGYDIADYCAVHPRYGTLADFKVFLREAHRRDLRVITELVLNHTSDQHPWFQRARHARPGSRWRDYYVWSDSPGKYAKAPIIFKDAEASNWSWDPVARAYYWHRFFSHQPDLNFDNPEVHRQIFKVMDFWLDLGVDGLRLDAVPYLYEREGTTCENLPETHACLKKIRAHVDEKYSGRMLLAEANLWPEEAVTYFGQGRGDECHMAFHFPLMPRLFMALRMEDRLPIVDILEQTPPLPEAGQWALFLRNHDELTLSTVTDEERDYMYHMYAQVPQARLYLGIRRRLAPLLNNDRKSIELLNALLFSLPGTPVLYYGDEIGLGDNIYLGDRDGVRTPMQWSPDKNAGFSRANPQGLYLPVILDPAYHYEACNVETQLANPHSLLWWMRRLLMLRKRWRALGEGTCEFLQPDNQKVIAYILRHENEIILVAANLSRFAQSVELDLTPYKSLAPIELFGRTKFPALTGAPYSLTLGPHNFFWFSLEPASPGAAIATAAPGSLPALAVNENWREILAGAAKSRFEALLPGYLNAQPWVAGLAHTVKATAIRECIRVPLPEEDFAVLALVQAELVEGRPELHALPLAFAAGPSAVSRQAQGIASLTVRSAGQTGVLYDAFANPAFAQALLRALQRRERFRNGTGEIEAVATAALRQAAGSELAAIPTVHNTHDGNTTVVFGDALALKFFRRLESGVNPELEVGRFLTELEFPASPPLLGALEYRRAGAGEMTLAVARAFIPHAKNAWQFTLDALGHYYDQVLALAAQGETPPPRAARAADHIGTYLESARLLGQRTAELHLALASGAPEGDFAMEPVTRNSLRGLYQSMRYLAIQNLRSLRKQLKSLHPGLAPVARRVAELEPAILQCYHQLIEQEFSARRIRIHGDFHLGQVLWTGRDFVFLDFEGDGAKPISARRIKRSPLRDVARMLRSFHHAAYAGLRRHAELGALAHENVARFEPWIRHWNQAVGRAYVQAYCEGMRSSEILPADPAQLRVMLAAYLLDHVVEELGDELRRHSDNVAAPLQAIIYLTQEQFAPAPAATPPPAEPQSASAPNPPKPG